MQNAVEPWTSLGIFERTVAVMAHNGAARIRSFQNPLFHRLFTPPIVLNKTEGPIFQRELIFPTRQLFPSDNCGMDNMAFMVVRNPENEREADLHCVFFHGDDEECDFDNPTSSFGATLRTEHLAGGFGGAYIPASKIVGEIEMEDGRIVELDMEDWFDACLYQSAARPTNMPRPKIMDKLEPGAAAAA